MKKIFTVLMALSLVLVLLPVGAVADTHEETGSYTLYAGQDNEVGTVTVSDAGDEVCVTYALNDGAIADGWLIYETHFAVATSEGEIPQNKSGNPVIGQFPYGDDELGGVESYTECIDMADDWNVDEDLFIAAHAVIEKEECEDYDYTILSNETTEFWDEEDEEWKDAVLAWVHDSWNDPSDIYDLVTDGAEWIWESERVENPAEGDVVEFQRSFDIAGEPTSGRLYITTDNGYEASVNGEFVGSAQLSGDWRESDLTDAIVDPHGWEEVEEYDILSLLQSEANILEITGVNEQQDGGTVDSNPAGVIYKMEIESQECTTYDETAWGAGERFVEEGNWATYFIYTVE